jgi:hypothetical protein
MDSIPLIPTAARPMDEFDLFVSRLGDRDRLNVERHIAFCEAEPSDVHEKLWKRLTCALSRLAPHAAHTSAQRAVRFFVADGKYRLQRFALEDLRDGYLAIYVGDALRDALDARIICGPRSVDAEVSTYEVCDDPGGAPLEVEVLTAAKTTSAPDYFKHMLGWNRRALRVRVPLSAGAATIAAVEALCALSASDAGSASPG